MKKQYISPKLTVHGTVEIITRATGTTPEKDTLIINGRDIPVDGCNDIIFP